MTRKVRRERLNAEKRNKIANRMRVLIFYSPLYGPSISQMQGQRQQKNYFFSTYT